MDSFKPGRALCSLQLSATLSDSNWAQRVPKRSYLAKLNGAKEPSNQMVIVMDQFVPVNLSDQGRVLPKS